MYALNPFNITRGVQMSIFLFLLPEKFPQRCMSIVCGNPWRQIDSRSGRMEMDITCVLIGIDRKAWILRCFILERGGVRERGKRNLGLLLLDADLGDSDSGRLSPFYILWLVYFHAYDITYVRIFGYFIFAVVSIFIYDLALDLPTGQERHVPLYNQRMSYQIP